MTTEAERVNRTESLCIGWPAPDGCTTHGDMHGCNRGDPHPGATHQCDCGATTKGSGNHRYRGRRDPTLGCGSDAGFWRHRRAGEEACVQCKHAHAGAVAASRRVTSNNPRGTH